MSTQKATDYSLVKAGENLTQPRNLSIVGIILVTGIGGMSFSAGKFTLEGIALAAVLGVVLNLILPQPRGQQRDLEDEVEV